MNNPTSVDEAWTFYRGVSRCTVEGYGLSHAKGYAPGCAAAEAAWEANVAGMAAAARHRGTVREGYCEHSP